MLAHRRRRAAPNSVPSTGFKHLVIGCVRDEHILLALRAAITRPAPRIAHRPPGPTPPHQHHLRKDGERDLLGGFGTDIEADRRMHGIEVCPVESAVP